MAAPALNLDLTGIAVDQLEIPDPIANAFANVQTVINNLGNIHIASDAAIATAKLELGGGSATSPITNNNVFYRSKKAAGAVSDLIGLDSADNVIMQMNIDGTMRENAHEETYTVNVGTLGANAQSAQQTMTFRRAFGNTAYDVSFGGFSTEGNGVVGYGRVRNNGSLTFYVQSIYGGGNQTNCTVHVTVKGYG